MSRTTDPRAELVVVPASSLTASAPPCSGHEGHEASEQRGRLRRAGTYGDPKICERFW